MRADTLGFFRLEVGKKWTFCWPNLPFFVLFKQIIISVLSLCGFLAVHSATFYKQKKSVRRGGGNLDDEDDGWKVFLPSPAPFPSSLWNLPFFLRRWSAAFSRGDFGSANYVFTLEFPGYSKAIFCNEIDTKQLLDRVTNSHRQCK